MNIVAFDTETGGLDWWEADEGVFLITWADERGTYATHVNDVGGIKAFYQALKAADVIVCHNAPFDIHQVRESIGFDILELGVPVADTHILARVLLPEGANAWGAYKLKRLSVKYLADDSADGEVELKKYAKAAGIKLKEKGGYKAVYDHSPKGAEITTYYARQDAKLTRDLYIYLTSLEDTREQICALEMKVMPILIEAERIGVKLDKTKVAELKEDYEAEYNALDNQLQDELGLEALGGAGSESALIEALQKHGVPLYRMTKGGDQLSTAQFALQEFEEDYPIVRTLMDYRRMGKFLTTYIGALDGRDKVHTSFHQCDAWTGRMSSSRPNMQNFPKRAGKELREVFVPRPGHAFVVCDYESIEIRLLAYYLDDPWFIKLIEDGHDAHAWMASIIWGGEPSQYAKDGPNDAKRGLAKNILFAITYGGGGGRLNDMLLAAGYTFTGHTDHFRWEPGLPSCDCEGCEIARKVKSNLPGYYDLTKRIKNKVQHVGHVNTLMGRKQIVGKTKGYVGLNALIQGSAADVMKQGLVNVAEAVRPLEGTPLLVVHDEVVVEVPTDRAVECLLLVTEALVSAAAIRPGLAVSGKIVHHNYGEA